MGPVAAILRPPCRAAGIEQEPAQEAEEGGAGVH